MRYGLRVAAQSPTKGLGGLFHYVLIRDTPIPKP